MRQAADLLHTWYLQALSDLPWRDVIASRVASFDSMRDTFLHLIFAEDFWIN
jgi:hypothetical protein